MSQVTVEIGGRSFEVVCQEGEEQYLQSAAQMLDEEAQKLDGGSARITESKMLLMAGLLLADRTAATEEKLNAKPEPTADSDTVNRAKEAEAKLRAAEVDIASVKAQLAEATSALEENNGTQDDLIARLRSERDEAVTALKQIVTQVQELANA